MFHVHRDELTQVFPYKFSGEGGGWGGFLAHTTAPLVICFSLPVRHHIMLVLSGDYEIVTLDVHVFFRSC